MKLRDVLALMIFLPLLFCNAVWAFSVVTCPRFLNPDARPRRFCTACHGFKWPWRY